MTPMALLKKLAWTLGATAILLIFVVLDWLPTVKDLNRLRRERLDEVLKIKKFDTMTSSFVFPDAEEKSLLAQNDTRLHRSLPQVYDNEAWLALALSELQSQVRAERIASARVFFTSQALGTELGTAGAGRSAALTNWLSLQVWDLRESFYQNRYPWHDIFSGFEAVSKQRLASRELGVALAAPLSALLGFINCISWGEARLEIVRLHLEPGAALSQAWLICRGNYLVCKPSAWAVKEVTGTVGDNLPLDPDSDLLWQPVDSAAVNPAQKKELPPIHGSGLFVRKRID